MSWCRLIPALACAALVAACDDGRETENIDDAGTPAKTDAGTDAGADAGTDAGTEADAGTDAGTPADTCGFDAFNAAVGIPCNVDADCHDGLCLPVPFGTNYCTKDCALGGTDCPSGTECTASGAGAHPNLCTLVDEDLPSLAAAGSLKAGHPCGADEECAGTGARCAKGSLRDDDTRYTWCAPACTTAGSDECGACGFCENYGEAWGNRCTPKGPGRIGDACDRDHLCGSFICIGFCTQQCGEGAATPSCPDEGLCKPIEGLSEPVSICISERQNGKTGLGGPCVLDLECTSGNRCLANATGTATVCTAPKSKDEKCRSASECQTGLFCVPDAAGEDSTCQPPGEIGGSCTNTTHCKAGLTCRAIGPNRAACTRDCAAGCGTGNTCIAPDMDTEIAVFSAEAATFSSRVASNDDVDYAGGNAWSATGAITLQPGTYWVRVSDLSYSTSFLGAYLLEISDGANTPASDVELPETAVRNDKATDAQRLAAVPVLVAATFDKADDIDFFKFTITDPTTLRFSTRRGEPTACLPNTQLGTTALGGACATHHACASGLCEGRLQACGRLCATDAECGAGFKCALLQDHKTCIDAADVGTSARGETCRQSYECQDGYCASFRTQSLCTSRCENAACPAGQECTELTVSRSGNVQKESACVPQGAKATKYNNACVLQSDCEGSLYCEGGRCQKSCAADAECPGHDFGTQTFADELCATCDSYLDCGDAGWCEYGNGDERFCITPCGAGDTCPAGFSCVEKYREKYCRPTHGSCRASFCSEPPGAASGECAVPASAFAEVCTAASDCTTRACSDGLCTQACTTDADCGCGTGDLLCSQQQCRLAPLLRESEGTGGNDTLQTAQPLTGSLPIKLYGELRGRPNPSGGGPLPDKDVFKLQLAGGVAIDLVTRGVCGTAAPSLDTLVKLFDANGTLLKAGSGASDYATILNFTVPADGQYLVEVSDDALVRVQTGAYVLEVKKK